MAQLLIKCNNIGLCASVNNALKSLIKTQLPFSASIYFISPYYTEVVEVLKDKPNISCGVYLSLTSEWKNNRFSTATNPKLVPSLVGSDNFLFPNCAGLLSNRPKIIEIEREIHSQITRALSSGLNIQYLDFHTSLFRNNLEIFNAVVKAANEYKLFISGLNDELISDAIYHVPIDYKQRKLISMIDNLSERFINVFVFHIGLNTEELRGLRGFENNIPMNFSRLWQAELDALCSTEFRETIMGRKIKLVNYNSIADSNKIPKEYKSIYKSNSTILHIAKIITKQLNKI